MTGGELIISAGTLYGTLSKMEKESWLHDKHKNGWKLLKIIPPCFYIFEKCISEDVVYRLDFKNDSVTNNYFQIFSDYGWEYIGQCVGWLYFRKSTLGMDSELDSEIFSDNESRIEMIDHVTKEPMICVSFLTSSSALRLSVWHFCFCDIQLLCIYQCLLMALGTEQRKIL